MAMLDHCLVEQLVVRLPVKEKVGGPSPPEAAVPYAAIVSGDYEFFHVHSNEPGIGRCANGERTVLKTVGPKGLAGSSPVLPADPCCSGSQCSPTKSKTEFDSLRVYASLAQWIVRQTTNLRQSGSDSSMGYCDTRLGSESTACEAVQQGAIPWYHPAWPVSV